MMRASHTGKNGQNNKITRNYLLGSPRAFYLRSWLFQMQCSSLKSFPVLTRRLIRIKVRFFTSIPNPFWISKAIYFSLIQYAGVGKELLDSVQLQPILLIVNISCNFIKFTGKPYTCSYLPKNNDCSTNKL